MPAEGPELMYNQLRKFITVVDELRDCGLQQYINLPRIAVLGSQSAGKSSVLESIVGLDFLPRGDGVVTRRPLELRLNHMDEGATPYAVFPDEIPGKKFTKFNEVRDNIVGLTDKMCGANKNIIDKPIVLQVYSHTCPDLTLIDLPGITRIAIADQPDNIEKITRAMAHRYVSDPRTIILCVVPANADMTTSDGLQMARQLDPKGIRTIGVITKIDIMDRGTNAKRMISNLEVPLRLGYVGVKNRAQEDIVNQIPVREAIAKEQAFFAAHPIYSTMPPELLGCDQLTKKLSKILFVHIKHSMPAIINEVRDKQKEAEHELRDLGQPMPSSESDKKHLLWNMLTEFVQTYKNQIGGKYDARRKVQPGGGPVRQELSGGARIKMGFYKLYADLEERKATQEYTDMNIERAIAMHEGDSIPGFPSVDVFYYLAQPQLEKLREPALDCLNDVYAQLEQLCSQIIDRVFLRFPSMRPVIMDIIIQILQELREYTKTIIESIIDAEQSYFFTNDLDYKESRSGIITHQDEDGKSNAPPQFDAQGNPIPRSQPNQPPRQPMSAQKTFVQELRQRIDDYYAIVLRNVRDTVPKQIGYFLVKKSQEQLQSDLYMRINANQSIVDALGEPRHIMERRKTLNELIKTLSDSVKVLTRDPELTAAHIDDSSLSEDIRQDAMARKAAGLNPPPRNNPNSNPNPNPNANPGPNPNANPGPNPNPGPPRTNPPGVNPGPPGGMPPGGRPPGGMPPGGMPPGGRPPGGMPPGGMPPGGMPPGGRPPSSTTGSLFGNPLQK